MVKKVVKVTKTEFELDDGSVFPICSCEHRILIS